MLRDLGFNLLAVLIGFLAARAYSYLRQTFSKRISRWFWVPVPSSRIFLYYSGWKSLLSDVGELEPVVNVHDALTLGELRIFLKQYYQEIFITTDKNAIDWQCPVVSIGGPLPNPLAKEVGDRGLLPLWFYDLPYTEDSERVIGSTSRAEMFISEFDETGRLTSDVGIVARLRSPENRSQFLYIVAGNYGIGTLGVVRFISSAEKLARLRRVIPTQSFQAIIRSRVLEGRVIDTALLHYRELD